MKEILYLEVPTPESAQVLKWLQADFTPPKVEKVVTRDGIRLGIPLQNANGIPGVTSANLSVPAQTSISPSMSASLQLPAELSIFVWSLQRTTYVKVFRWADRSLPQEAGILRALKVGLAQTFPVHYPVPPTIDLTQTTIFDALAPYYPKTVHHFRAIPNGEADLTRAYWWEQRWRDGVQNPKQPKPVIFQAGQALERGPIEDKSTDETLYDLIYIGGALGTIHAAMMAQLGYRVLLVERLTFGRMNREWNISRDEFQSLIDLGLFTPAEFEDMIAREYRDGFHKFFDANNPPQAKAHILQTPTVLNIAIDSDTLLQYCGEKLRSAGGEIWDRTEFSYAVIEETHVTVWVKPPNPGTTGQTSADASNYGSKPVKGRLLIDAMGTASPIAWQLNQGRPFDSVCPTVGAVLEGLNPEVWNSDYGDVLNSHGDISRGRQLIWELFPGKGQELTVYLFHYHQIHPDNPGSLLEMYEDFFMILPEYRRCDLKNLTWKKATFGYIPGYFSVEGNDRRVAFDRLMAIGDAASLQSPLIFTGFGSLVRNLPRLTDLLNTVLKHDLLTTQYLNQIRAYQSNVAVTWLFSKGMMVPTGQNLPPERINAMLNTFFAILASESPQVSEAFMKDRATWLNFTWMALKAAKMNPKLLIWIWQLTEWQDVLRWLTSYLNFTILSVVSFFFRGWFPRLLRHLQPWLETHYPTFWFWLLAQSYLLTDGVGRPQWQYVRLKQHLGGVTKATQPIA